jgi:hypothetical protein
LGNSGVFLKPSIYERFGNIVAAFCVRDFDGVIAVNYHPINRKYWTERSIGQRLKAVSRSRREANATALENTDGSHRNGPTNAAQRTAAYR